MDLTTIEQAGHLETELANLIAIRDRAASDLQRAVVQAEYSGAGYGAINLGAIREDLNEVFAPFIGPVERRLEMLNEELGRGPVLDARAGRAA